MEVMKGGVTMITEVVGKTKQTKKKQTANLIFSCERKGCRYKPNNNGPESPYKEDLGLEIQNSNLNSSRL